MRPDGSEKINHLDEASPFQFRCHGDLPCFTQCCRDVNVYLTPYDVLRMRSNLKMGSKDFLAKYTRYFLAEKTHLPVVQLRMNAKTLCCELVTDEGCSVYQDRPWACRMYPLDPTNRQGEYRAMVSEQKCLGLKEPGLLTVKEWLVGQGIEPYLLMDEVFETAIPSVLVLSGKLEFGAGKLLFLAYDLDQFAAMLKDKSFRSSYELSDETIRQVEEDQEALLRLAFTYIRSQMDELLSTA